MDEDYRTIKVRPLISDMPRLGWSGDDAPVTIRRASNGYLIEFPGNSQQSRRLVADDVNCLVAVILHLFETRDEEAGPPKGYNEETWAYKTGFEVGYEAGSENQTR